ncbi:unnamed protein product [Discosporangium mesarthrocarpum]
MLGHSRQTLAQERIRGPGNDLFFFGENKSELEEPIATCLPKGRTDKYRKEEQTHHGEHLSACLVLMVTWHLLCSSSSCHGSHASMDSPWWRVNGGNSKWREPPVNNNNAT